MLLMNCYLVQRHFDNTTKSGILTIVTCMLFMNLVNRTFSDIYVNKDLCTNILPSNLQVNFTDVYTSYVV